MLKSPKLTAFLTLLLISAVVVDVYQIKHEFESLNEQAENLSKPKPRVKKEETEITNLEEQCG